MGEQDKIDLLQLFSKKLNIFITITLMVLGIFLALFTTFMIKSSNKDGVHDTQIAQILVIQEKREAQIDKLSNVVGILTTSEAVKGKEMVDIATILKDILERVQKAEWAIVTDDPSKITERGLSQNGN